MWETHTKTGCGNSAQLFLKQERFDTIQAKIGGVKNAHLYFANLLEYKRERQF
jgi:hypothetical protein